MNQRIWITVSLVALFGLRGPVCLYACAETDPPAPLATAEHHSSQATPCHGSAAPEPEQPPSGEHQCDCEGAQVASTKDAAKKPSASWPVGATSVASVSPSIPVLAASPSDPGKRQRDLPPPDILLLTSTLLI